MGLSRRFLNLIVRNQLPVTKSLHHLFDPSSAATILAGSAQDPATPKHANAFTMKKQHEDWAALTTIDKFQLPEPIFNFKAQPEPDGWDIDCFPLSDRRIICADQSGRTFLFDAETHQLVTMPSLHKPKWNPFSIFVPSTGMDADHCGGGKLYVMKEYLRSEAGCRVQHSDQFEVFVSHKPTGTSFESWHCHLLPPQPFVRDYAYSKRRRNITSYAVVGDDRSHIFISAGEAGTYCLDTVSDTWSRVGEWTLPFCGKVEYVPELKLWFGLSAENQHLAAVDLSAMDSQPQLVGRWKDLGRRWEWLECEDSQLVNLGSGKFCIARFYMTGFELTDWSFTVLNGVEVKPVANDASCSGSRNSEVELEVTTHKSLCHLSDGNCIDAVF